MSDLKKIFWFALFLFSLGIFSRLDTILQWSNDYKWQLSSGFGILIFILVLFNWTSLRDEGNDTGTLQSNEE